MVCYIFDDFITITEIRKIGRSKRPVSPGQSFKLISSYTFRHRMSHIYDVILWITLQQYLLVIPLVQFHRQVLVDLVDRHDPFVQFHRWVRACPLVRVHPLFQVVLSALVQLQLPFLDIAFWIRQTKSKNYLWFRVKLVHFQKKIRKNFDHTMILVKNEKISWKSYHKIGCVCG